MRAFVQASSSSAAPGPGRSRRPDRRHGSVRSLGLGAALAVVAASLGLGCSSGDPVRPVQAPPATDVWMTATIELLDERDAYFDCDTLLEVPVGTLWPVESDEAFGGVTRLASGGAAGVQNFQFSGTDTGRETGVSIFLGYNVDTGDVTLGTDTRVVVDATCDRLVGGSDPVAESVFRLASGSVTLTEVPLTDGAIVPAEQTGPGELQPPAIVEGTFEFTADNLQASMSATLSARVRVTGCFRLNAPLPIQQLPVVPGTACN